MIKLNCATIVDDDFGIDEVRDMYKVARHYNWYGLDVQAVKDVYVKGTINANDMPFVRAIELVFLRLSEANGQCKLIKERQDNGKKKDRARELDNDLKDFENTKRLLLKYSDNADAIVKGLNTCISDIKRIQNKLHGANIRYGYGNCLHVLDKRLDYLESGDIFITKAINTHLDLLVKDLEQLDIVYSTVKLNTLFFNYINPH